MNAPYHPFPENPFKTGLRERRPMLGLRCVLGRATIEMIGRAGFDWLLLDPPRRRLDVGCLASELSLLDSSASAPVVRPQWNEGAIVHRLLDAGFHNFLMPSLQTAADVEKAISHLHRSHCGAGDPMPGSLAQTAAISLMAQVGDREGLENLAAIAAVDGVDAVFVQPFDVALALGCDGDFRHPDVKATLRDMAGSIAAAAKAAAILAESEEDAQEYLRWGFTCIAVDSDARLFDAAVTDAHKKNRLLLH